MESLITTTARVFKRFCKQPIGIVDYDEIWAETTETGVVVKDSKSDMPLYRICAVRLDQDNWTVTKEKRQQFAPDDVLSSRSGSEIFDIGSPTIQPTSFYYEPVAEPKIMATDDVMKLMKERDPNIRNVSQHYSRASYFPDSLIPV